MPGKGTIEYYPLDEIAREFLKYAPAYAQEEAKQAISKVAELQSQGILRDGLYYVVLVDLAKSTSFAAEHGDYLLVRRIQTFVKSSLDAFNTAKIRNAGLFLKEIGDAVLFLFQHFPDILRWQKSFQDYLSIWSRSGEPYVIRTCVHVGEVCLDGVNPLSLAVSQTFKMEKAVPDGAIALTESAYRVAWPTLARAYHGFERIGAVSLPGYDTETGLYRLCIHDADDLERIIAERAE